jgi:hypothetical protein
VLHLNCLGCPSRCNSADGTCLEAAAPVIQHSNSPRIANTSAWARVHWTLASRASQQQTALPSQMQPSGQKGPDYVALDSPCATVLCLNCLGCPSRGSSADRTCLEAAAPVIQHANGPRIANASAWARVHWTLASRASQQQTALPNQMQPSGQKGPDYVALDSPCATVLRLNCLGCPSRGSSADRTCLEAAAPVIQHANSPRIANASSWARVTSLGAPG